MVINKCPNCSSDFRYGTEQVGVDNNNIPVYHRFGYCDKCRQKYDIDLLSIRNENIKNKSTKKKDKSGWLSIPIIILVFLIIWVLFGSGGETEDTVNKNSIVSVTTTNEPEIKISKEEYISSCIELPYKTLARNPEDYIGQKIVISVKITQVLQGGLFDDGQYYRVCSNDEYDMWLGDEYFMYDSRVDDDMKILEDDIIKVYGEFVGMETVTRALTNTKEEVPAFKAIYIELISE